MTDDLNQEPEQNPDNTDFAESEVNLTDDPAVHEAMMEELPGRHIRSWRQPLAQFEAPAAEIYDTENTEQRETSDDHKKPGDSIWGKIQQLFQGNPDHVAQRIYYLDEAIENAADTPANYVLRGELYLSLREYALARRDFQRAQELAAAQFQKSDWGLMAQAMEDRALIGLQKAEKRLQADSL